jgi:hypothetical protein
MTLNVTTIRVEDRIENNKNSTWIFIFALAVKGIYKNTLIILLLF